MTSDDGGERLPGRPSEADSDAAPPSSSTRDAGSDLYWLLRASRVHKVLPLALLIVDGALITGKRPSLPELAIAVALTLVVIILGMQLNVLTDDEIDRVKKPHLAAWLGRSRRLLSTVLWTEAVLTLGLWLLAFARRGWPLALSLGVLSVASLSYSYNFLFPARAAAWRLKIHWLGHAGSIIASYASLWVTGLFCAAPVDALRSWGWLFVGVTLVDYSVFLNESAADAEDERRHGLRTTPALLGQRRTSLVALFLWLLGVAGLLLALRYVPRARRDLVAAAMLTSAAIQGAACAASLWLARRRVSWRRVDRLVDASFWLARLLPTVLLLWALE